MLKKLLLSRRSTRKFTEEPLPITIIEDLSSAIYFSASSRGLRPYRVIYVADPQSLKSLSKAKKGAELLDGAKLGVVIAGDTAKSDVWIEDCSIAAANVLNLCEEKELGACWVQVRNRDHSPELSADKYVRELLGIPDNFSVGCIIGIGHRAEIHEPYRENQLDKSLFSKERFGF